MKRPTTLLLACSAWFWFSLNAGDSLPPLPTAELDLVLDAPIDRWDEALPLGNGTLGVLLWGADDVLRLSLDRGDLWDERPSPQHVAARDRFTWKAMQEMVAATNMAEFDRVFDSNYDYNFAPTKLPAGRIEISLPKPSEPPPAPANVAKPVVIQARTP